MTDKNRDVDKTKTTQNEIKEEDKIEEVDKDNKVINAEQRDTKEKSELNKDEKNFAKEENDKNESKSSEKENQNIDEKKKASKDFDPNKEGSTTSKGSSSYFNSTENLKNLEQIRKNLQINNEYSNNFNSTYDKMIDENKKLEELYRAEDNINKEIIGGDVIMDDDIFEYRTRKILSDKFDLKEYLCYPYFTIEYCQKKNSNMVKLYYYNISFESVEEMTEKENRDNIDIDSKISSNKKSKKSKKKESIKKNADCFAFLDDRETYLIVYKQMPMIFHKNDNNFNSVNIISEDFKSAKEFFFRKVEHDFITTFTMADINKELLELEGEKTRKKNE